LNKQNVIKLVYKLLTHCVGLLF